jgi:hypothetical protein
MESLLERGEKLDDLVSKSEVLGTQSKAFYKTVSSSAWPSRASLSTQPLHLVSLAFFMRAGPLFNQDEIWVLLLGIWGPKASASAPGTSGVHWGILLLDQG